MRVEILAAPEDAFVLGRDLLGYANLGDDPDEWVDLLPGAGQVTATRGGTTGRVNALDVGTLTIPLKNADPVTDLRLRVGRHVRLYDPETETVLWYGRITDIPATDEGTYTVTTLVATDAVDSLANSTRYGAGDYGTPETLRSRVGRLSTTATVALRHAINDDPVPAPTADTWAAVVMPAETTLPVTPVAGGGRVEAPVSWNTVGGFILDYGIPEIRIPLPDDPPGRYLVTATAVVNLAITGGGSTTGARSGFTWFSEGPNSAAGPHASITLPAGDTNPLALSTPLPVIRQPGDALGFRLLPYRTGGSGSGTLTVTLTDVTIARVEGPAVLQAVAYEGPVSEHLNMACDSVGAVWRPTLDGGAEILEGRRSETSVASFTDNLTASPADASYTRLEFGYATGDDLVNDLTVTNHGRTSEGDADDTTHVATNATSIANYGRRSGSLDTCLAAGVDARAGEVLAELDSPAWGPRSVTYVYRDLGLVPDLYEHVTVYRLGAAYTCPVLGVEHQITPDPERPHAPIKHLVTLTLGKAH